ncbi:MAG: queuosine precursor transporter [Patescibacteria group bacterium]
MINELIFVITALLTFGFVFICFNLGKRWLHASIAINLILISVFGAKLVSVFGITTNVGNIFYAAVFLAAHILIEHYGEKEGRKSFWVGLGATVFFVLMGQLTVQFIGSSASATVNQALNTLFTFAPRIFLASISAYFFAQKFNIWFYGRLAQKSEKLPLWQRDIFSNILGQAIDSIIFFSIAFYGIISGTALAQAMLFGFIFKVAAGIFGLPFFYATFYVKKENSKNVENISEKIPETSKPFYSFTPKGTLRAIVFFLLASPFVFLAIFSISEIKRNLANMSLVAQADTIKSILVVYGVIFVAFSLLLIITFYISRRLISSEASLKYEQELKKSQMEFLSLASHELRTPLSGTKWLVETLQDGMLGPLNEKQKSYVENISLTNEKMIKLVVSLLNVTRLDSTTANIKEEEVDVLNFYDDLILLVEAVAKKNDIVLKNNAVFGKKITVKTDLEVVKSILTNFLSNSIFYSPADQEVVLDFKTEKGAAVFFVKDNGIGIPKEEAKHVFDKFYRASNAGKVKPEGMGIGLYVSFMLSKKIGAEITFDSEEGKGSTFYLKIPML